MSLRWFLAVALAFAAPAAASAQETDPLAPARAGMIVCFEPDDETKRCSGIYTYSFDDQGGISVLNEGVFRDYPDRVHSTREPVVVVSGVECWPYDPEVERRATWRRDGKPLDAETTARLNAESLSYQDYPPGTLICLYPKREGDFWRNDFTTGGGAPKRGTRHYAWVDPADGWKVLGDP